VKRSKKKWVKWDDPPDVRFTCSWCGRAASFKREELPIDFCCDECEENFTGIIGLVKNNKDLWDESSQFYSHWRGRLC